MISDLSGTNIKEDFRSYLKARLRLFTENAQNKLAAEAKIISQLESLLLSIKSDPAKAIAGFNSLREEPNLSDWYSSQSGPLAFPKVLSQAMEFVIVKNYKQIIWDLSPMGFRCPALGNPIRSDQIQAILVPGLGFSMFGERLGRGKGFYDKYLADFKGLKIGICFDCQWTEDHLPTDDWDIEMNYIITESKCIEVKD